MRYLIILLFSFSAFGQTVHNFDNFAGATTEVKWGNMYNAVSATTGNDVVQFTSGQTYNLTSMVHLHNVDGLTLQSTNAMVPARLITNQTNLISRADGVAHGVNNLIIENLYFASTSTFATGNGGANSLLFFGYAANNNHIIRNCEFTAPNAVTNAIKYWAVDGGFIDNIEAYNNYIHDMGRMGLEAINHIDPRLVDRITNVHFHDNRVHNTGLIIFGMGISLSGRVTDALIENNEFINNPTCGVELIGGLRNIVRNNTFSGTGDPVHTVFGSGVINTDVLVENNISTALGSNSLIGVSGYISRNNSWFGSRNLFFNTVENVLFENDDFNIFGENPFFQGGTPTAFMQVQAAATGQNPNGSITFQNCNLKLRNNVSFAQIAQGTVNVICSTFDHPSNATSLNNNGSRTDVRLLVNGVFNSELGDTGTDCGVIGYVAPSNGNTGTITISNYFSDNMIIQRDQTINVWGTGTNGDTVTATYRGETATATVADGVYLVELPSMASGTGTLTVSSANSFSFTNVTLGDIWVVSGQSNMEWTLNQTTDANTLDDSQGSYPNIRMFNPSNTTSTSVSSDISDVNWLNTSAAAGSFSAIGYIFAREVFDEINIPIGLVNFSKGGESLQAFYDPASYNYDADVLAEITNRTDDRKSQVWNTTFATANNLQIKGILWLQGEQNAFFNEFVYRKHQYNLIQQFRNQFYADMPFILGQIANNGSNTLNYQYIRDAQRIIGTGVPNVGYVTTIEPEHDLNDVHPTQKLKTGQRYAAWALSEVYNVSSFDIAKTSSIKNVVPINPTTYDLFLTNPSNLTFVGTGNLVDYMQVSNGGAYQNATTAVIDGSKITITTPITNVTEIRYATDRVTYLPLRNAGDAPVSSFRTNWSAFATGSDTTPPNTVTISLNGNTLSWTGNGAANYVVYRNDQPIQETSGNSITLFGKGGQVYVRARDSFFNYSELSNEVSFNGNNPTPPSIGGAIRQKIMRQFFNW